jgi:undecaprenyl diphosphate synthase
VSSTQTIPESRQIPRHIAIIMDGNGRWATKRFLPRVAGHKKGVDAVRDTIRSCSELGIEYLTLFAFSSENWRRPKEEVSVLMRLFMTALQNEVARMNENSIRLRVVGDLQAFDPILQQLIVDAELKTCQNNGLCLTIAANYGGRWDMLQAMRRMVAEHPQLAGHPEQLDEALFQSYLSMADAPEPDLFIRTGGERRISNFLLWQLAYTELYFTDAFWPDFDRKALDLAIVSFQKRERRFGRTSEQLQADSGKQTPAGLKIVC